MTPESIDVSVFVDYHWFTVFDGIAPTGDMPRDPWDKSVLTGLLSTPRVIWPVTWSRWGFVPVRLDARESSPADPANGSHVVEASLRCTTGRVSVGSWVGAEQGGVTLPIGSYAVRVSWFGLPDHGDPCPDQEVSVGERFHIEVWPAPFAAVRVMRQCPLWSNESLRMLFAPVAE